MIKQQSIGPHDAIIIGDDFDELVAFCLDKVRHTSKAFYGREIPKDLLKQGYSWIDYHAGNEIFYRIELHPLKSKPYWHNA